MSDHGLTDKGFKRKRYNDIIRSMNRRARELFGGGVNLTERSILGLTFRVTAWFIAQVWQLAERVYHSGFYQFAYGKTLDARVKMIGIKRRPAEPATGEVEFEGDDGTTIPEGFLISTEDDTTFKTTEEVEIGGVTKVSIEAIEPGTSGNVEEGTITEIVNPEEGIDSVTNPDDTEDGRDIETDTELRKRYEQSLAKPGASTLDSIRASLLDVEGVRTTRVYENVSMEEDEEGRPPKSIEAVLLGGDEKDIGKAILNTKAAGIEPYGTESVEVEDVGGQKRTMYFSWADEIDIYVLVEADVETDYPEDGDEKIKGNIIEYVGGEFEGTLYEGLGLEDDVIQTAIISAIRKVRGVKDVTVKLDTSPEPDSTENISIDFNQVASTSKGKIEVDTNG